MERRERRWVTRGAQGRPLIRNVSIRGAYYGQRRREKRTDVPCVQLRVIRAPTRHVFSTRRVLSTAASCFGRFLALCACRNTLTSLVSLL